MIQGICHIVADEGDGPSQPCDHTPVACVYDPSNTSVCLVAQLHSRWTSEPRPFHPAEHPLVYSIWQASYDRHKVQYLASDPGYGMTRAPEHVKALEKIGADERLLPHRVSMIKRMSFMSAGSRRVSNANPGQIHGPTAHHTTLDIVTVVASL